MARTLKWEHRTDSWHIGHRLERQARPAGRIAALAAAELDMGEVEPFDMVFEPVLPEVPWQEEYGLYYYPDSPCGGSCRRCLIHGDPGGCVG